MRYDFSELGWQRDEYRRALWENDHGRLDEKIAEGQCNICLGKADDKPLLGVCFNDGRVIFWHRLKDNQHYYCE